MDSAELKFLTRGLLIEADPSAGPRFRTAAVRLDEIELDTEARWPAAADAARLLVGLALGGAADELGELLTPDPAVSTNKWTVACYEIGGLTPVAVREFDDPVEAVVTVSACPDEAHVAAELVASNEHGLRWTAVWRTDDHVSFQLPSTETVEAGEESDVDEHSDELLDALRRWRMRLAEWSGHDATSTPEPAGPTPSSQPAPPAQLELAGLPAPTPAASAPAHIATPSRPTAARLHALEQRLSGIESTLGELNAELQAFAVEAERREDSSSAAVERAIDVRFQVLAKVVQSALDRLSAQLVDDMQQVARETARSTRDIEAALREETGTVLMGIRAGLSPLTKEVIERISIIESQTRRADDKQSNVIDMRGSSA